MFVGEEATLVEVNPLIVTPEREVKALDAKVTLDGNALFRHPDNAELRDLSSEDPQERMAKERGLTYVKLDGNIGILGNGAGLVMSTLDVVAQAGGAPANFLDAGGGSKAEAITQAVEVILANEAVKAVLFNIFGGITRCDEVAQRADRGLRSRSSRRSRSSCASTAPTTSRDARCWRRPRCPTCTPRRTMDEAAEKVVELAQGRARPMSILVDDEHAALRLRDHRPRGHLPHAATTAPTAPTSSPA